MLGSLGAATDPWRVDESFTFWLTTLDLSEMNRQIVADVHPPLFYWLMAAWLHFGHTPNGMVLFTLLVGLAAVLLAGLIGRHLAGSRSGIAASLLWATCAPFLHFSQDARMYGLGLLFELLAIAGWLVAPRRPRAGWLIFALSLTAACYTHYHCLVFSACFISLAILFPLLNPSGKFPSINWVLSAAVANALAFLPWSRILWRQLHNGRIDQVYHAPSWAETLGGTLFYSVPNAGAFPSSLVLSWLLGVAMLGLLPLAALFRRGSRPHPASPAIPVIYLAAACPFILLWCFSKWYWPVFSVARHGILFLPLLLLPAATLFQSSNFSPGSSFLRLSVFALLVVNAFATLRFPRDVSIYPASNTIMDLAPLGLPIFSYPINPVPSHLDFAPIPLAPYHTTDLLPVHLTSCTLILTTGSGQERDSQMTRTRALFSKASSVRPIYTSYNLSAYVLRGLPDGALRHLYIADADSIELWTGMFGNRAVLPPLKDWSIVALNTPRPPGSWVVGRRMGGQMLLLGSGLSQWQFELPLVKDDSFFAFVVAGENTGQLLDAQLDLKVDGSQSVRLAPPPGRFSLVTICRGNSRMATLTAQVPHEASVRKPGTIPPDDAPGICLLGACCIALRPGDYQTSTTQASTHSPTYSINIGDLGDEFFLRSPSYEREGVPTSNHRWTGKVFEIEIPVWAGSSLTQVSLVGFLPREIANRQVNLELDPQSGSASPALSEMATSADYGNLTFHLPRPLVPGIHRFRITLGGTFSPAKPGETGDHRALGFFLDRFELN